MSSTAVLLLVALVQATPVPPSTGARGSDPSAKPPPQESSSQNPPTNPNPSPNDVQPAAADDLPVSLDRIQRALAAPGSPEAPRTDGSRRPSRLSRRHRRREDRHAHAPRQGSLARPGSVWRDDAPGVPRPRDPRRRARLRRVLERGRDHGRGDVDCPAVGGAESHRRAQEGERRARAGRGDARKWSRRSKRSGRRAAPPGLPEK